MATVDIRLRLVLVYITADKMWLCLARTLTHIDTVLVGEVHPMCEAQVTEFIQSLQVAGLMGRD